MADVRYFLRDVKSTRKTVILLSFGYKGKRMRVSTGISTAVSEWDPARQRFIEHEQRPDLRELNLFLDTLAKQVINKYNQWLAQQKLPEIHVFKKYIQQQLLSGEPKEEATAFWMAFDDFVQEKRLEIKDITDYDKALRKHLKGFQTNTGVQLSFELIRQRKAGFAQDFERYLAEMGKGNYGRTGLSRNTIGKQFKNLKVFLKWCFENERVAPFSTAHLVTFHEEIYSVYLTQDELELLERLEPSDQRKRIVRDLFLIGCETGLRFSDFSRLDRSWIIENNLYISPQKGSSQSAQQRLIIPVSARFERILAHYPDELPTIKESQLFQFNSLLRELAQEAGIVQTCLVTRMVNTKMVEQHIPKALMISSHTARRTFCTLKFLAGMPVESIMKFSGHRTERNFLKYLRLDNELNADHFRRFF